jgi:hypothetical protein
MARAFSAAAAVFVVGGSYDRRPRRICDRIGRSPRVTLLEDTTWENLYGVLDGCAYCFGHASGFTAIADALGVKGATYNPYTLPHLTGTWNDPSVPCLHVNTTVDFDRAAHAALEELNRSPGATWPPTAVRGTALAVEPGDRWGPGAAAVYAAARACVPREAVFVYDEPLPDRDTAAACVHAVLDTGEGIDGLTLVGVDADTLAALYRATARTTRRPKIDVPLDRGLVAERYVGYGLGVAVVGADRRRSIDTTDWAWARVAAGGTLLVGGPGAEPAATAVATARRARAGAVGGAPGWFYLHRML